MFSEVKHDVQQTRGTKHIIFRMTGDNELGSSDDHETLSKLFLENKFTRDKLTMHYFE